MNEDVLKKAARIEILILDVDGVLTDGSVIFDGSGEALKVFNVRDGAMIKWLQRAGVEVVFLSGRDSAPLRARARELLVAEVLSDVKIKLPAFNEFVMARKIDPARIAYMGDDLIDLPVLRRVGLSLAPADAVPEVIVQVDWVASSPGGRGAVREAGELLLRAAGKWEEITARYRE